jgi:hypothetical protein
VHKIGKRIFLSGTIGFRLTAFMQLPVHLPNSELLFKKAPVHAGEFQFVHFRFQLAPLEPAGAQISIQVYGSLQCAAAFFDFGLEPKLLLVDREGQEIPLRTREFQLLSCVLECGRALSVSLCDPQAAGVLFQCAAECSPTPASKP